MAQQYSFPFELTNPRAVLPAFNVNIPSPTEGEHEQALAYARALKAAVERIRMCTTGLCYYNNQQQFSPKKEELNVYIKILRRDLNMSNNRYSNGNYVRRQYDGRYGSYDRVGRNYR